MTKSVAGSIVLAFVVNAVLCLAALVALQYALGGEEFARRFVNDGALALEFADAETLQIAIKNAVTETLKTMHLLLVLSALAAMLMAALWLWRSHKAVIDRPGMAVRLMGLWALFGLLALILIGVAAAYLSLQLTLMAGLWLWFLLGYLTCTLVCYWVSAAMATPSWVKPAVPGAGWLP